MSNGKRGIINYSINDKASLYAAFMPFIKNGGLFIPQGNHELGDEVFVLLTLMNDPTKLPIAGKVIWVTPTGAQGSRQAGMGIKFSEQDNGETRRKIETILGGALKADRPTHTM